MIHFLWSIFFLVLTMALVLAYVAGGVLLLFGVLLAIQFVRQYRQWVLPVAWQETIAWAKGLLMAWSRSKKILYILLLVLALNISLYLKQRVEWMGKDNGNLTAKEYWVAGQVVYAYRNMYCLLHNHPDDYFIRPFTWLQEWIYQRGSRYLPENDGETGVWADIWFIYPYSRRFHNTKGVDGYNPSPRMIALVERTWFSLEKQATGNWADSQMKIQHYYRNFPGEAFYYISKKGFLTGRKVGSRKLFVQESRFISRDRYLLKWLEELREKWQTSPSTLKFVEQHPKVEAFRQLTCQMEAGDLLQSTIFRHEFSCNSPEVQQYVRLRAEFVGNGRKKSAVQRMTDRAQAQRLYNIAVNTMISRFHSYILERFCGIKVAGEEDMSPYIYTEQRKPPIMELEDSLKNIFNEEIQILEEMYHGR